MEKLTALALATFFVLSAKNVEAQTPAQLRRQIADKERQLNTMHTQLNQKTDRAIAFDARHRPTVQNRANQIVTAEIRDNALQFWIDTWNPNLPSHVCTIHDELPRRQTEVRRRHIQSINDAIQTTFPTKYVVGSAGDARFEDVRAQAKRVGQEEVERALNRGVPTHQVRAILNQAENNFLRDRGRLKDLDIAIGRVYCRPSWHAREELRGRIEDTRLAKIALQHQYRVANKSPAERAAYNRARGW